MASNWTKKPPTEATMDQPRAIHEIESDGQKLLVKIQGAIESGGWLCLYRLSESLREIAERGLYHESLQKSKSLASFALNGHRESDPR